MPVTDVSSKPLESLTVTRERLAEQLSETLTPGTGRLVVVRGMPGSGVSTFIRKILTSQERRGASTAYVTLDAFERLLPYSALERMLFSIPCTKTHSLDPSQDIDLFRFAAELLPILLPDSAQPKVIAIDPIEFCDEQTARILRYLVDRLVSRGAIIVVGDTLAHPSEIGTHFAELALHSPWGQLLTLGDLSAGDIIELIRERAGVDVTTFMAEKIRGETQGRLAAVIAYLSGFTEKDFANLTTTRVLPLNTAARMRPHFRAPYESEPDALRVTGELCAITQGGVTLDLVRRTCNALGIDATPTTFSDDDFVQKNSFTGQFHLRDPLAAREIIAMGDPAELREINRVLADSTYGVESYIYRLNAIATFTATDAQEALREASRQESAGDGQGAVRILEVAMRVSRGTKEYDGLRRAFGLTCIRQLQAPNYQTRLGEFAEGAATDPFQGFIYAHFRTAKGYGDTDAAQLRESYVSAPTQHTDHAFLQADIAFTHCLVLAQSGSPAERSARCQMARDRLHPLVDSKPDSADLQWLDAQSRLDLLDAVHTANDRNQAPDVMRAHAAELRKRASELSADNPFRVDILIAATVLLGHSEDLSIARTVSEEIRELESQLLRPVMLAGTLETMRADIAIRDGNWQQARETIAALLLKAGDFNLHTRVVVSAMAAWLAAVDDRLDEATRFMDAAQAASRGTDVQSFWLEFARIEVLRQQGKASVAVLGIDDAARHASPSERARLLTVKAELLFELRDFPAAEATIETFAKCAEVLGPENEGHLAFHRANVSLSRDEPKEALQWCRRALELLTHPFAIAKCRVTLGYVFERLRTDPGTALAEFDQALQLFSGIGAAAYVRFTEHSAKYSRQMQAARHRDLSERERQVANLAANGWTNPEIARELNISASTAAFHVSNVLKKLGIASRSEIARSFHVDRLR